MYNIAIVGKMGSGKSSLANYLVDVHQYTRIANAGSLKALAAMAYGPIDKSQTYKVTQAKYEWDGRTEEREFSGRQILQGLGQIVKEFDRDFWLKAMMRDMDVKGNGPFVCDDTRFPFEADFLRKHGWIIVKLYVPKEVRAERYHTLYGRYPTIEELSHESETAVDDIEEDIGFSGESPIEETVQAIFTHMDWRDQR